MMRLIRHAAVGCLLLLTAAEAVAGQSALTLRDGDHVVLLGATFIERAQQYGHLEAMLTTAANGHRVTFRNLGWSGDTVFAESRGIFDPPAVGYQRMIDHVISEKPTVLLICYGQNEALQESISADTFAVQLTKLIGDLKPTNARIVLMTPTELLPAKPPIPSPSRYNSKIAAFAEVVRHVAQQTGVGLVDLFRDFTADLWSADRLVLTASSQLPDRPDQHPELLSMAAARWSDNGMHLNDAGYRAASLVIAERLVGAEPPAPVIRLSLRDGRAAMEGGDIRSISGQDDLPRTLTLEFREHRLSPVPVVVHLLDQNPGRRVTGTVRRGESSAALTPITLRGEDGTASFSTGVNPQYDELRELIVRKNELYFHRWRPQNVTYLFGFRKHEQGNNAVEIPQFDPLVKDAEDQIHDVRQPRWRTLTVQVSPEN